MSRIGSKPVSVPAGVEVSINGSEVTVKGKRGPLSTTFRPEVAIEYDDGEKQIKVSRKSDERQARALHGLTRAMLQNMVIGVTDGYIKKLEIVGVGYVAAVQNNELQLRVGYANEVAKKIPAGLTVTCPDQQHIQIEGIDKQLVGQFAAEVRAVRKPEPYKGKGIRYEGEHIRRKAGKAVTK